jgi:hypothetical protein
MSQFASPVAHAQSLLGPNHPVSRMLTGLGQGLLSAHQQPGRTANGGGMIPTSTAQPAQSPMRMGSPTLGQGLYSMGFGLEHT